MPHWDSRRELLLGCCLVSLGSGSQWRPGAADPGPRGLQADDGDPCHLFLCIPAPDVGRGPRDR